MIRPQATYVATVDVHQNAVTFCRSILMVAGVVAILSRALDGSKVGDSDIRLAFCNRPGVMSDALRRLQRVTRRVTSR